jgi:hypothetical protein
LSKENICKESKDGKHHYGVHSDMCIYCGRDVLDDYFGCKLMGMFMNKLPLIMVVGIILALFIIKVLD